MSASKTDQSFKPEFFLDAGATNLEFDKGAINTGA
jgi:hypothetical protein